MTCVAAVDVRQHVDATACFPVKNSFSDVIINEHLKLKTANGDTVWGGLSQNRQTLPILDPKIVSLQHFYF